MQAVEYTLKYEKPFKNGVNFDYDIQANERTTCGSDWAATAAAAGSVAADGTKALITEQLITAILAQKP